MREYALHGSLQHPSDTAMHSTTAGGLTLKLRDAPCQCVSCSKWACCDVPHVLHPAAVVVPGPADMGFSFGLHVKQDYDLPAMMASPDMQHIYSTVVQVGALVDRNNVHSPCVVRCHNALLVLDNNTEA